MGSKTILKRLLDRFNPADEWEPEETITYVDELRVKTEDVTIHTTMICPKCKAHSHMVNEDCPRCDMGLF